jgi:hypothetical protein
MVNLNDLVDWAMMAPSLAVAFYLVGVLATESYSIIGGDHEAPSTRSGVPAGIRHGGAG